MVLSFQRVSTIAFRSVKQNDQFELDRLSLLTRSDDYYYLVIYPISLAEAAHRLCYAV